MNKQCGLTLIEIMVTLVILSVLLGISYSKFDSVTTKQGIKNAQSQIGFAIQSARYYSRVKGVETNLKFPVGSDKFSISANDVELTRENLHHAMSGVLPNNVKILSTTCEEFNIYVDGSLQDMFGDPLTNCTITVGRDNTLKSTLSVHASSGSVTYD